MNTIAHNWLDLVNPKRDIDIETTIDPLVISCILYRLCTDAKSATEYRHMSITNTDTILGHMTTADCTLAEHIRTYYQQKLLMLTIKQANITRFRSDLSQFLNSSWVTYPKSYIGMIYKLPYLYAYDKVMTTIFDGEYRNIKGPCRIQGQRILTYLRSVNSYKKFSPGIEYWFMDEDTNRVMLSLEKTNPLRSIFEKIIKEPFAVNAKFEMRSKDSNQFYTSVLWNCVA